MLFFSSILIVVFAHVCLSSTVSWDHTNHIDITLEQCVYSIQMLFANNSLTVVVSHGSYSTTVPRQLHLYLHVIALEFHKNTTSILILL